MIPHHEIRRLIRHEHVGASDDHIRGLIRNRAISNNWPDPLIADAEDFAIEVHRENQQLYERVARP